MHPTPQQLFESPDWKFLTAPKIEGQFYERKVTVDLDKIAAAILGFATVNREGGLLVDGIRDDGTVQGLDYLGEAKVQELLKCVDRVNLHGILTKLVPAQDREGRDVRLLFIYAPFSARAVPEDTKGRAFKRVGDSTIELRDEEKRELQYTKGQISFEDERACPLVLEELDPETLAEVCLNISTVDRLSDTEELRILRNRFLVVEHQGELYLTNAGYLLLHREPRRLIPGAYVRFLRYAGREERVGSEQNVVKDEFFSGPVPRIVLQVRDFVKAQLRQFSFRGPEGRFITQDEYPEEAWDEAIINALVHRSYSFRNVGIFVRMFDDRFEVVSPGDYPLGVSPVHFMSHPRNPHLMDIMRYLRLVKMMSEGTQRMMQAMERAGLPLPEFSPPGHPNVKVVLRNDTDRRRSERGVKEPGSITGYTNLFPLKLSAPPFTGPVPEEGEEQPDYGEIKAAIVGSLVRNGYNVDSFAQRRFLDFRREHIVPALRASRLISLYPAADFRIFELGSDYFLCLDPAVEVRNRATLDRLVKLVPGLVNRRLKSGFARLEGEWKACRIVHFSDQKVLVKLVESGEELWCSFEEILPNVPTRWLAEALRAAGVEFELYKEIRRLAMADVPNAPRHRSDQTRILAGDLSEKIFPLTIRNYEVSLTRNPEFLDSNVLRLAADLSDPDPVFDKQGHKRRTVLEGLTELGAYTKPNEELSIAILCTRDMSTRLKTLLDAIRLGSARYRGVERTFGISFGEPRMILVDSFQDYLPRLREFDSRSNRKSRPFFLVYAPEAGFSRADYTAPYYQVKHFLLEHGYASQMVDEDTVANPRMKELNLALDIFAKSGHVPWVLAEGLPAADLFVGLSFSSIQVDAGNRRIIAYVNVFDRYGRWQYYKSGNAIIDYERRTEQFRSLVRDAVAEYKALADLRRLHIHHSAKLSREDRNEIVAGVREAAPDAGVSFVWVNSDTPLRLYDSKPEGDGSLHRGAYVITAPNRFYISTTGSNELGQRSLGTPQALEITVHRVNTRGPLDLRIYAQHILSLTKLNWASARTFARDPITIKFARDIAYLVNVFLAAFGEFRLHPDLDRTAWFL